MLSCTHVHANQCIPVIHMHNFSPLWCLQWVTKQNRGLTPSGFNFCDPSSSLWSRHRAAEQRPFGNICGQLRGEEGAKERNLLLINKIMGAIRPFSHHHRSQSLPLFPPLAPRLALPYIFYQNYVHHSQMGWKTVRKDRECKKTKPVGKNRVMVGVGDLQNQQLTGVRMFMGRVGLSHLSSDTSAVAFKTL